MFVGKEGPWVGRQVMGRSWTGHGYVMGRSWVGEGDVLAKETKSTRD